MPSHQLMLVSCYENYETALKTLKLDTLEKRRELLMIKYGKKCLKLEQTKDLFPVQQLTHNMNTRNSKRYKEHRSNTERYRMSTVPYLQRILNSETKKT